MTPGRAVPRALDRSRFGTVSTTEPYGIIRHGMRHGSVEPRTARRTVTVLITAARLAGPDRTGPRLGGPARRVRCPVPGSRVRSPRPRRTGTAHAGDPGVQRLRRVARSPQVIPDDLVLAYIRTARHRL